MSLSGMSGSEVDHRLAALSSNVNAVRTIAAAVEGTIGSKGLDTMLVDRFGDVVITNDGITILSRMEVKHPAARMVIGTARAQEEEIGDGTTTATIMAGTLLSEGLSQVARGVPITRIIEGIRSGIQTALKAMEARAVSVASAEDPLLKRVALVAGRGHRDIADLVTAAAGMVDPDRMENPAFRLADTVLAREGAESGVLSGVVLDKRPLEEEGPQVLEPARILMVDDGLEPEEMEEEALSTEAGFTRYLDVKERFRRSIAALPDLGVNLIIAARGVSDEVQEILGGSGIMIIRRVSSRDMKKVAAHTGARPVKRTALGRPREELEACLGSARTVRADGKLKQVAILEGAGRPMATILIGAATGEVVDERERIARDAAGAVQAALRGGVVPGGGALELACSVEVQRSRSGEKGMTAYGVDCVVEALRRPFSQIVANAGFNPLEKMGDVMSQIGPEPTGRLGLDLDTGDIADMWELGVLDPLLVKSHALKAAGEIAEAILRIDTVIKKREEGQSGGAGEDSGG